MIWNVGSIAQEDVNEGPCLLFKVLFDFHLTIRFRDPKLKVICVFVAFVWPKIHIYDANKQVLQKVYLEENVPFTELAKNLQMTHMMTK